MVDNTTRSVDGAKGLEGTSLRDKWFRAIWTYLRGLVLIGLLFLLVKGAGWAYTSVAEQLEPLLEWTDLSRWNNVLMVAVLVIGPWILGKVVELSPSGKLFQQQRNARALHRMETKLSTELKADRHRGFRVALVNVPSKEIRSIGLIVAELREPETGRELAAIYLPRTPDPHAGSIRIVPTEDLTMTDWGFADLAQFHLTFGSACPDLSDDEAAG